jgi:hypothetical protein
LGAQPWQRRGDMKLDDKGNKYHSL